MLSLIERLRSVKTEAVAALLAAVLLFAHVIQIDFMRVDFVAISLVGILIAIPFLDLVRKVKIGNFEAEIAPREVAAAVARAERDPPAAPLDPEQDRSIEQELLDEVHRDPRLGLAKARIEIETALRDIAEATGNSATKRQPLVRLADELVARDVIPPELNSAIRDVLPLANRAVHGEQIDFDDALQLAHLAARVIDALRLTLSRALNEPVQALALTEGELERYTGARYRVETVIPYVENPVKNVRVVDQEGLNRLLERYHEYAEFVVSVTPVEQ